MFFHFKLSKFALTYVIETIKKHLNNYLTLLYYYLSSLVNLFTIQQNIILWSILFQVVVFVYGEYLNILAFYMKSVSFVIIRYTL